MKQVIQNIGNGDLTVQDIADPVPLPGYVLIATTSSVISPGTERYVVDLARRSLIGKAIGRPEHVRRILQKVRQEGLVSTFRQVREKLDEPMSLGYSSAGVVLECGRGVSDFKPGEMVAAAAPHAGLVCVGQRLCARVPQSVTADRAAYASLGAIALEGVRLARVSIGERVLVIGLGLVGQLVVALLKAQGARVFGTDLDPTRVELGFRMGMDAGDPGAPREVLRTFSGPAGVDAAIITASTESNDPIEFAAESCRVRGRIVLVGVAGLTLPRPPFFKKELEFTVSGSLGPGRGDPAYEERGVDYPLGFVRWTAQRNMEAALDLMAAGKLPVERLTTHRFPVERASDAYDLITKRIEPSVGVLLEYPSVQTPVRVASLKGARGSGGLGVSVVGAGNFARLIMLPLLQRIGGVTWRGLCTARGLNAVHTGSKIGFAFAATDAAEVLKDRETNIVFIATRHNLHAELVVAALRAGKHVYVEKPLCITLEELTSIEECISELDSRCPVLMIGLNRRFAPATEKIRTFFKGVHPLSISYRFSSGYLPAEHWTHDEDIGGGRIVGEACHAIDLCSVIAGSPPVKIYAESIGKTGTAETSDDRALISLRHENGSISSISYQGAGDRACPPERIEVFSEEKTAIIDSWDVVEFWQGGRVSRVRVGKDKGHENALRSFINACRDGERSPVEWADWRSTALACLLAVKSLRQGYPIDMRNPCG
ncbi:MAG: bi-domain-containing oxidoreductase [Planctomycetes bacterium]|nr:bi-domain-containing oxidoreductase [Planctomycetota bacterium]